MGQAPVAAGRLADRHARRRPDPDAGRTATGRRRRPRRRWRPPARCCRGCARCRTTSGAGTSRPTPTGCSPPSGPGDRRELAVGFADLVGYTSRSRGMGGRELGAMIEDFESIAAEVIARHSGRVVKTVGDGVLFTAGQRRGRGRDRARAARGVGRRGPAAAAHRRRLRAGAHPPRRRLLAGGQPGQPADLARPAGRPCSSTASWPSSCAATRPTGCGRCKRVSVRGYDHLQPWLVRRRPARATTTIRSRACSTSSPTTSSTGPTRTATLSDEAPWMAPCWV